MHLHNAIERYATLALDGSQRSFPYHLSFVFHGPEAMRQPSDVHPAFFGCFDWHSAVHGHWLLAHTARECIGTEFSDQCLSALKYNLKVEALKKEAAHLESNKSFERPYGLAWVLMLAVEIHRFPGDSLIAIEKPLCQLASTAYSNIAAWLPKLSHPVRTGTHNQTAFSMKLALEWANHFHDGEAQELLTLNARRLFQNDRELPTHTEPSGEDFLSPAFGEAWLMSSVLMEDEFTEWFDRAFPDLKALHELRPLLPADRTDGRLVHLDGLNLSRAWMLGALARRLGRGHAFYTDLKSAAISHGRLGLESALSTEYMASHWLGTFAVFLLNELNGFVGWDEFFPET